MQKQIIVRIMTPEKLACLSCGGSFDLSPAQPLTTKMLCGYMKAAPSSNPPSQTFEIKIKNRGVSAVPLHKLDFNTAISQK